MRTLFSILAVLLVVSQASALEMSVGAKGGIGLSKSWGAEDIEGQDEVMKLGFTGGALLEMKLMDYFSIQPEVLFAMKGTKYEYETVNEEFETVDASTSLHLNYIEIPVLLKANFPLGAITPSVYAGPAVAFRVGFDMSGEEDGDDVEFSDEFIEDTEENIAVVDFGIAMGAGVGIEAGPGSVLIDARYTLGLLNVDSSEEEPEDGKNMNISFMAGYAIDF